MKRRMSHGQAMRSILGRWWVIHLGGRPREEGSPTSSTFPKVGSPLVSQDPNPPSRKRTGVESLIAKLLWGVLAELVSEGTVQDKVSIFE
jgi:hypothetical protein